MGDSSVESHVITTESSETVYPDVVWSYPAPVRESGPIAGLACFYDEKVDITVDGVTQNRPITPFS